MAYPSWNYSFGKGWFLMKGTKLIALNTHLPDPIEQYQKF